MRILLIHPPSKELFNEFLPLGLAYIAGSLLRHGHQVVVWDLNAEKCSEQEVLRRIEEKGGSFNLIGITGLVGDYHSVRWIVNTFKNIHPETKIVLGGYLASALSRFLMETLPVDFVVVGEGEEIIVELTDALENSSELEDVKGIYFRDDTGRITANPPGKRVSDLEQLPVPPWEYFPMETYLNKEHMGFREHSEDDGKGIISIMAGRGCPFDCIYCDHTIKGYAVRYRSVKSVIHEIKQLKERYGDRITRFYFWDDILIWDKEWTYDFCNTLIHEDLKIKWTCNCHVGKVDSRLMTCMKQAGCMNVRFGIESGSQKILDSLNKGVKVGKALEALKICMDAGLHLTIYMLVGMKGESRETVSDTLDFFRRLITPLYVRQVKKINVFMLTPFPGTRLFDKIRMNGFVNDLETFLDGGFDACNDIPFNLSGQDDNDLRRLKNELEEGTIQIVKDSLDQFDTLITGLVSEIKR